MRSARVFAQLVLTAALAIVVPTIPAQAATGSFTTSVVKNASCNQRAAIVDLTFSTAVTKVTVYWGDNQSAVIDKDGTTAGTFRYVLPRQSFGSSRSYEIASDSRGDQGSYTDQTPVFTRPARSKCVVTRNLRITSYAANVNQDCGDYGKLFVVKAFVAKGSPGYIVGKGYSEIVVRPDTQRDAEGYVVPVSRREVDFFIYAKRSDEVVKKTGDENSVTGVLSSAQTTFEVGKLSSSCQE